MNMIKMVEENLKIETFLKENYKLGYSINEMSDILGIKELNLKRLLKIRNIECRNVNGVCYCMYRPFEKQLIEALGKLVEEKKINVELKNGIEFYSSK